MQNIERKGLDMVRRDWSLLSKEIGDFCLNQILLMMVSLVCLSTGHVMMLLSQYIVLLSRLGAYNFSLKFAPHLLMGIID